METEFTSYKDSVKNKQFQISPVNGGVRIVYALGDVSKSVDEVIPKRLGKVRFEAIAAKLPDEKTQKDFKKRFKLLAEENVYERREGSFTQDITAKYAAILEQIGYTAADLAADNEAAGAGGAVLDEKINFTLPLEYRLDGENLVVSLAADQIKQPSQYRIRSVRLLPYFGAAGDGKEGYLFVPDGSGALIHLNNGKTSTQPYAAPVYGEDGTRSAEQKIQRAEPSRLPVFGLKQNDDALFAVIEQGDAVASIEADIGGRLHSYNHVNASFTLMAQESLTISGGANSNTVPIFQPESYHGAIAVRYAFLHGDQANYAGMAGYYQRYLQDRQKLRPLQQSGDIPFYLELIGDVDKRKSFLAIPYNSYIPLTTFGQAKEIVEKLQGGGVKNIQLRYVGWFNGGVNHSVPKSVSPDGNLGGKSGFSALAEWLKEQGVGFYPDVSFTNVYKDTRSFSPSKEAARFINKKPAKMYPFLSSLFDQDKSRRPYYVLSPSKLAGYVDSFADSYGKLGVEGLSLRDLGGELNSDFRASRMVNRQDSLRIAEEQMKKLAGDNGGMLIAGGNAYSFPYASHVLHAPDRSSGFNLADESVPFYQMVLHGYIEYAGQPVNVANDQSVRTNLLKSLEYGASVYFQWFYAPPSAIKNTEFDRLYSSSYEGWLNEAVAMYGEANDVLKDVRASRMTGHEKLAEGVFRTSYGNGTSIIVNYNEVPYAADGVTVKAESFYAGRETT